MKKTDKIIYSFPVLWEGWECDPEAWIIERLDGTRYLKMTNHGGGYIAEASELHERIKEYASVIEKTEKAIRLLGEDAAISQ